MMVTVIVLAIIVAVVDYFIGIKEPWKKLIWIALVVLFIVALVMLLVPGLVPLRF
jgi:hypothetical protein